MDDSSFCIRKYRILFVLELKRFFLWVCLSPFSYFHLEAIFDDSWPEIRSFSNFGTLNPNLWSDLTWVVQEGVQGSIGGIISCISTPIDLKLKTKLEFWFFEINLRCFLQKNSLEVNLGFNGLNMVVRSKNCLAYFHFPSRIKEYIRYMGLGGFWG